MKIALPRSIVVSQLAVRKCKVKEALALRVTTAKLHCKVKTHNYNGLYQSYLKVMAAEPQSNNMVGRVMDKPISELFKSNGCRMATLL